MNVLANHPAKVVYEILGPVTMDNDKGYVRTLSVPVFLKGFENDKYEYVRSFTIGVDTATDEPFVYGNGSMLSDNPAAQSVAFGVSLGDVINVEGRDYTVQAAANSNLKLVAV